MTHFYIHSISILFLLILIKNSKLESNEDQNILKVVKRNLLCREKEYLKTQPLSENLKSFIRRYKRKAPVLKLRKSKGNEYSLYEPDKRNIALQNQVARNADQPQESIPLTVPHTDISIIPPSTAATSTDNNRTSPITCRDGDNDLQTDEYDITAEESTTQRKELLGKVMKDVQELIRYENAAKTSEGEASLCNVTGDWDSFAGGMQIRIFNRFPPETPVIRIVPQEPPMNGFLSESGWNATAIVPFKHSSLLALTAVSTKGKKIANFLGECRICEGSESITGHWMIRRRSKNCKDREEANTFISDVLRKNNVRKLHKEHLVKVLSTTDNLDGELTA